MILDGEDHVAGRFVDGGRTVTEGEEEGLGEAGREGGREGEEDESMRMRLSVVRLRGIPSLPPSLLPSLPPSLPPSLLPFLLTLSPIRSGRARSQARGTGATNV